MGVIFFPSLFSFFLKGQGKESQPMQQEQQKCHSRERFQEEKSTQSAAHCKALLLLQ